MPSWPGPPTRGQPPRLRHSALWYGSNKQFSLIIYMTLHSVLAFIIGSIIWNAHSPHLPEYRLHFRRSKYLIDSPPQFVVNRHSVKPSGTREVWAQGPAPHFPTADLLRNLLGTNITHQLRLLCSRCLYRTLTSYVRVHEHGHFIIVLTGDIPAMWLRDSAVQMAAYIPRVARRPALRHELEGAIRAQAYFILQV